ncbi:MAG TPA: V-type ATPase subunit, partial [Clostridiales bacterium]|nr:V-type ATPase subunit [Clostridiales bacterium]
MNPYTAYYAADAKISAKKGKVLDEARLRGMMECETVDQVADYIKNKYGLAGLIYDAGSNTRLFRDDLEQLMTRYMVRETEEML